MGMKLPCRKKDLEFLKWEDAYGLKDSRPIEDLKELTLAIQVNIGWVILENEKLVIIVNQECTTGEREMTVIPRVNIVEREFVVPRTGRRNKSDDKPPDSDK